MAYNNRNNGRDSRDRSGYGKGPRREGRAFEGREGTFERKYDNRRARPMGRDERFKAQKPWESGPRVAPPKRKAPPAVQDDAVNAESPLFGREEAMPENILAGRNPIREAIKAGRTMEKILVARGELSGSAREIVAKAREAGIVVQEVDRARLDAIYPSHQGMLAFVSAASYSTVEEILELAETRGEDPFVVLLDGITDPHNLGAVIRTAECCGAHGVIVPERRSVGLTPAAVKAAAGATEYMKVAKVVNLNRTLELLKQRGLWVIGADMAGEPFDKADLTGPIALVIGAEGEGISSLVLKNCDRTVSLPMKGKIESLNASVAAGVLMYAVMTARGV